MATSGATDGGTSSSSAAPTGRARAPTITIDTPATDPDNPSTSRPDETRTTNVNQPELAAPAIDDKTSRPTSAHNVSSQTSKVTETKNFLAVPSVRSRNNSLDSAEDTQTNSYGGDTATSSPLTEKKPHNNNASVMNDPDALTADPGTEDAFHVEDNKFAFSPGQLTKLVNPKSPAAFYAVGGLAGLETGLRTNRKTGLSADETTLDGHVTFEEVTGKKSEKPLLNGDAKSSETVTTAPTTSSRTDAFTDRKRVYSENVLPKKKVKNIFQLAWIAFNDKVLILLSIAAVISLALGLYQTFGVRSENGEPRVEWIEGVAIMTAIIIVVVVGAANDWQKERQFVKLNKKKEDRTIKVIRSGKSQEISVYDILVGDVVHLEPGDLIPVDGIFIEGFGVKTDESSATGESDIIKKTTADDVYAAIEAHRDVRKLDPFILSGSTVSEGVGTFLVTAVGVNSSYGKILVSLREGTETTPLQTKLNGLAENIAKLGGAAALLLFTVLLIKFLAQLKNNAGTPDEKGQQFLQILIVAITIVVVAVPEGLPLAVTLALAFATTRMLKDNNLVRVLRACETMGNATTVCSDKTGTLTQNKMTVVAGTIGATSQFGATKPGKDDSPDNLAQGKQADPEEDADAVPMRDCVATWSAGVKKLLEQSIAINSTAFEGTDNGEASFIGSKTETALLNFSRQQFGMGPVSEVRSSAQVVQFVPFDSGRKCMASVVRLESGIYRMYVKGASEIMVRQCTRVLRDPTGEVADAPMTPEILEGLNQTINTYATRSLRTIGLLYRDFESWPPKGARAAEEDRTQAEFGDVFKDMIFLGVVGIQDPLRAGVPEAVLQCQRAGVFVRMVTGDNITTARAIATECGIYTDGGVIMEGPQFRKLSKTRMDQVIPRLQVLARSSPEDKRILVKRLKELGETVAVTGDGTNDAPALKTADVGFSMGIAGTEVAKEASAIILMDDNFASIVKAIMWGRAVNDAVKKFLQFQLTVNVTAVILAFVSAVSSHEEESVLTAVQLLWVNLIMDTFAALALATDPPTRSILNRKPDPKSAPLITVTMWKMILGQSVYQLGITFMLYFGGERILSYDTARERDQIPTLVFNTFVWMQIFNQFNSRRLDNKFNIFEGIQRNWFFIGINMIMIGGQVMIIFVGGRAFSVTRLNGAQWAYSIILGATSMPVAVIIRLIPDELFKKVLPERMKRKRTPQVVVSDEDERFEWNQGLEEIREELAFLKRIRGGRLNAIKFKLQHPRELVHPRSRANSSRSRSSSVLPQTPNAESGAHHGGEAASLATPPSPANGRTRRRGRSRSNSAFGPAAAMAGVIAGSIGGWTPVERPGGEGASARGSESQGRAELSAQEGVEINPTTSANDPVLSDPKPSVDQPPSQNPATNPTLSPAIDTLASRDGPKEKE